MGGWGFQDRAIAVGLRRFAERRFRGNGPYNPGAAPEQLLNTGVYYAQVPATGIPAKTASGPGKATDCPCFWYDEEDNEQPVLDQDDNQQTITLEHYGPNAIESDGTKKVLAMDHFGRKVVCVVYCP